MYIDMRVLPVTGPPRGTASVNDPIRIHLGKKSLEMPEPKSLNRYKNH